MHTARTLADAVEGLTDAVDPNAIQRLEEVREMYYRHGMTFAPIAEQFARAETLIVRASGSSR